MQGASSYKQIILALTWIAGPVLDSGFTLLNYLISVAMAKFFRVRNSLDSALDP
jgi:hypothetical protein